MEVITKAKKWGNSLGVIIPKEIVERLGLEDEQEVRIDIEPSGKSDVLRKSFGLCKGDKKSAQEWKDEFRRTLYREH